MPSEPSLTTETGGLRRGFRRRDADCGRLGRGPDWNDERRLTSGDVEPDEAGDRCEGGV